MTFTNSNDTKRSSHIWSAIKPKLIILDVDETVLDQRVEHRMMIPLQPINHWPTLTSTNYNKHELRISFRRTIKTVDSIAQEFAHIVLFRNYLIDFIHQCRSTSNFLIYSLADPGRIIPNLILIEMYYNFVYQIKYHTAYRVKTPLSLFKFDYLIGSLTDGQRVILQKSMLTISELIGDVRAFREIYIVDDRAERVWIERLPPTMIGSRAPRIFPVQPTRFEVPVTCESFKELVSRVKRGRKEDEFFDDFIGFISSLSQGVTPGNQKGTLSWTRYQKKHQFTLCNGTVIQREK